MYNSRYEDIGNVTITDRIDISGYLRAFLDELSRLEGGRVSVNTDFDAMRITGLMNIPQNTTFKSVADLRTGRPYWEHQEVQCVPSNLGRGKGYIFYFICSRCNERTKYLYIYSELDPPLCRRCCRLPYKKTSYQKRKESLRRRQQALNDPFRGPFVP